MALRTVLPALVLVVGALASPASSDPPAEPPAAPPVDPAVALPTRGVRALEVDLMKTEARVGLLLDLADPAKYPKPRLQLRAYTRYGQAELQDKKLYKKRVTVDTLWAIVVDKKKDLRDPAGQAIRGEAAAALADSTTAHEFDPDLSHVPDPRGRGRPPRKEFGLKIVLELRDADPTLRVLAAKILNGLFPNAARSDADIAAYRSDDPRTFGPAIKRWERYLER